MFHGRDRWCKPTSFLFFSPVRGKLNPGLSQSGVTLIEVLVAMVLVSIGVMGALAMQARAMQDNQNTYFRSIAVNMAADMADRIRLNATAKDQYIVVDRKTKPSKYKCLNKISDAKALSQCDLSSWLGWVHTGLPDGEAEIGESGGRYTVTLYWDDRNPDTDSSFELEFDL